MSYLSEDQKNKISTLIHDYSGIMLELASKRQLEKNVEAQMSLLHIVDVKSYIDLLEAYKINSKAIDDLVAAITISETSFFRNPNQFEYMLTELLPALYEAKNWSIPVRIWSLGCSHGEEAYSIAMTMRYFQKQHEKAAFSINAGDINQRNLQLAQAGDYGKRSIPDCLADFEKKFGFSIGETDGRGGRKVSDDIKKLVNFSKVNLNNLKSLNYLKGLDIIFCRNVLIYFDIELRKKLIDLFFAALNPGGVLFIGEAECMPVNQGGFEAVNDKKTTVYRKPGGQR